MICEDEACKTKENYQDTQSRQTTRTNKSISLQPAMSKLFEKLFLTRVNQILESKNLIPDIQFDLSKKDSITEKIHRVVNIIIDEAFECKK